LVWGFNIKKNSLEKKGQDEESVGAKSSGFVGIGMRKLA
jgi:hypothetical protein